MNEPTPDLGGVEPMVALAATHMARKLTPKHTERARGLKAAKKAQRKAQKQARRANRE